jgi:SWI/SNF-related matrix-associated actin-dependent regulator 1 of chromatin subfamily A
MSYNPFDSSTWHLATNNYISATIPQPEPQPQEAGSYFGRSVPACESPPLINSNYDQNNTAYNYQTYLTSNEAALQPDPNSANPPQGQRTETHQIDQIAEAYYNPFASRSHDNYSAPQVAQVTRISFELQEHDSILLTLRDVDLNNSSQMNIIANIKDILMQNQAQLKSEFEYFIGTSQYHTIVNGLKQLEYVKVQDLPPNIVHLFINNVNTAESEQWTLDDIKQRLPEELWESLYLYQRQGVLYAVNKGGKVLIGDEMGLGKTIQATAIACYYCGEWPLLIICPASVCNNWAEEIGRNIPFLQREQITVIKNGRESTANHRVVILSYDLCIRMTAQLQAFKVIIVDESHMLKNKNAKRTQTIVPLVKNASRAVLLTGTAVLSRPAELFTQINALNPRLFPSFNAFGLRYCVDSQGYFDENFKGSCHLRELHLLLSRSIMIRRLKRDVLHELPAKHRHKVNVSVQVSTGQMSSVKMNENAEDEIQIEDEEDLTASEEAVLAWMSSKVFKNKDNLMENYRSTSLAKIPGVVNYVTKLLEVQDKFLVFAHHLQLLDAISQALQTKGVQFIRIDGNTSLDQRHNRVKMFQNNPGVRVAVLSITAAGAGITLTKSNVVVFAELYWTPGMLIQAEDRVHRIGQQRDVNIYYLVAPGTVDDIMWPMIRKKLDIVGRALNGVEEALKTIKSDAPEMSRDTLETLQPFIEQQRQKEFKSTPVLIEHSLTSPGAMISSFSNVSRNGNGLSSQIIVNDNIQYTYHGPAVVSGSKRSIEQVDEYGDADLSNNPAKRFKTA